VDVSVAHSFTTQPADAYEILPPCSSFYRGKKHAWIIIWF
jgi:hypothetical protein